MQSCTELRSVGLCDGEGSSIDGKPLPSVNGGNSIHVVLNLKLSHFFLSSIIRYDRRLIKPIAEKVTKQQVHLVCTFGCSTRLVSYHSWISCF